MVLYINCKNCGKVVDEYEDCCYWCGEKYNLTEDEDGDKEGKKNDR